MSSLDNLTAKILNDAKEKAAEIVKKEYIGRVKNEFPGIHVAEDESVSSGFIIEENGIQENYTFEVKLDFMRDELEVEISKLLFS